MRKKNLTWGVLIGLLTLGALLCSAAPFFGDKTADVQGAFYNSGYKCIYLTGAGEAKLNSWEQYTMPITKANLGYDGMSGSWSNMSLMRIKANTKMGNKEVAVFIDNVVLKDGDGKVVLSWDFNDGENHGPYLSQGKPLADDGKVITVDGETCFVLHAKSVNMYGYNGVEVQWEMPKNPDKSGGTWDLRKGPYVMSFSYYVASAE